MAGLVSLSRPVTVDSRTLTAAEVEQFVLRDQYIDYDGDDEGRLDALDTLTEQVFDQFLDGDLPSPRRLVDVLKPLADGDHIRLTTFEPADVTRSTDGEARRPVPVRRRPRPAGRGHPEHRREQDRHLPPALDRVRRHARPGHRRRHRPDAITLTNDAPADGLPDAIIGNNDQDFPFGTNRIRVHVYTPLALTAASLDDTEIELTAETELGWNRYRTTLLVGPGDSVVLTLDLAGKLDLSNGYVLEIEHQPMANPDNIVIGLNAGDTGFASTAGVDVDGNASFVLDADNIVGVVFSD